MVLAGFSYLFCYFSHEKRNLYKIHFYHIAATYIYFSVKKHLPFLHSEAATLFILISFNGGKKMKCI